MATFFTCSSPDEYGDRSNMSPQDFIFHSHNQQKKNCVYIFDSSFWGQFQLTSAAPWTNPGCSFLNPSCRIIPAEGQTEQIFLLKIISDRCDAAAHDAFTAQELLVCTDHHNTRLQIPPFPLLIGSSADRFPRQTRRQAERPMGEEFSHAPIKPDS